MRNEKERKGTKKPPMHHARRAQRSLLNFLHKYMKTVSELNHGSLHFL